MRLRSDKFELRPEEMIWQDSGGQAEAALVTGLAASASPGRPTRLAVFLAAAALGLGVVGFLLFRGFGGERSRAQMAVRSVRRPADLGAPTVLRRADRVGAALAGLAPEPAGGPAHERPSSSTEDAAAAVIRSLPRGPRRARGAAAPPPPPAPDPSGRGGPRSPLPSPAPSPPPAPPPPAAPPPAPPKPPPSAPSTRAPAPGRADAEEFGFER
jgi:hypothetical protein